MGQYYRPILTNNANGNERVYNRHVDGEYTGAKLMEHSWWENEFVGTICSKLFKKPMKVAWVGDYADDAETTNGIEKTDLIRLCKKAWDKGKGYGVKKKVLLLDGLFLVNHTKKIYVDCSEYKEKSIMKDGWCIHPLPLLTALGNGLGGGDYNYPSADSDAQAVGSWANDTISIEKGIPDGYEKVSYVFKEGE